jgi:pimeloyl-ACP methyl ester carboxylesterase
MNGRAEVRRLKMRPTIKSFLLATLVVASVAFRAAGEETALKKSDMNTSPKTGYAPVNSYKLYYEIHGVTQSKNPPLVLLHGGGDTITTSFGQVLPALARERQVIAFEQRGFGRTVDIPDRLFSFEESADDTAALLKHLHVSQADLFGFSNGGTIAFQVAIRHPKIVRKLIVASAFFKRDGGYPQFWDSFAHMQLKDMPKELQDAYREVAPHPENLQSFFDKCVERMRNFKDIPDDAIRGIAAPTFVICGDADVVRPEHAVETFLVISHAQLAILPDTDHNLMKRAEWIVPAVSEFLNGPMPKVK